MTALLLALWQVVKPHAAGVGACAMIALGSFYLGYHMGHPPAPLPVQIAHHDTDRAVTAAAKAETIFVRDTLRYAQWRTKYDTVRARFDVHDTVQVLRTVFVADSTIAACNLALESCARAGIAKDSVIAAKDRELAAWKASRPSLTHKLLTDAAFMTAGFVLGRYVTPNKHSPLMLSLHLPTPLLSH